MQLLSYAIFSTQKNGSTRFNKADFEKQFNMVKYATKDAAIDAKELMDLKISFIDYVNDCFRYSDCAIISLLFLLVTLYLHFYQACIRCNIRSIVLST